MIDIQSRISPINGYKSIYNARYTYLLAADRLTDTIDIQTDAIPLHTVSSF